MHNFVTMKIEKYIAQLLYRYQCVTVPGFGAFLTEIQSAKLNESTNSFFPPKKIVSFNSQIKTMMACWPIIFLTQKKHLMVLQLVL